MMNPPPPPTVLLEEDTNHHHHQHAKVHPSIYCCSLRESKGERRGSIHNYNCNAHLSTFFLPLSKFVLPAVQKGNVVVGGSALATNWLLFSAAISPIILTLV